MGKMYEDNSFIYTSVFKTEIIGKLSYNRQYRKKTFDYIKNKVQVIYFVLIMFIYNFKGVCIFTDITGIELFIVYRMQW